MKKEEEYMDKRNATRSWSGYVHQGRVGLLVALRELERLTCSNETNEIESYSIIYENAEDFDIKKNEQVISRHQVKCYKDGTTMSSYKKVLSVQIRTFKDTYWTLDQEGFQVNDYKNDGTYIENVVDKNSRYLHTIRNVVGFGLSEKAFIELKENNPDISNNLKHYNNPNNIQLYEYERDKKYCELEPDGEETYLRSYCLNKIEAIMGVKKPDLIDEPGVIVHRYNQLLDILDRKIIECHASKDSDGYPIIAFQEILEAILEDKHIEPSVIMTFRKLISRYWDQYRCEWIEDLLEFPFQVGDGDFDRIQVVLNKMACFTDIELKNFIYNIQPTKKKSEDKIETSDLNSLCTESQMKQIFFKVLLGVKKAEFSLYDATYDKADRYVLSLINKEKTEIRSAVKSIIESRMLLQNIYEKDFLINQFIDGEQVLDHFKDNRVLKATNNWGVNNDIIGKMDIRRSNLSFISAIAAIDKLNGENDEELS